MAWLEITIDSIFMGETSKRLSLFLSLKRPSFCVIYVLALFITSCTIILLDHYFCERRNLYFFVVQGSVSLLNFFPIPNVGCDLTIGFSLFECKSFCI